MNEIEQGNIFNSMKIRPQLMDFLDRIDNDIDQESLICLLDEKMTKKLYDEIKKDEDRRQHYLSKMFRTQVFRLDELLYEKEKMNDL